MFSIVDVTLNNFRSFAGEHHYKFPTEPGLYYLTGDNLNNVRLGRNGAGKSTLLEAICWCLYGKTTRGLRASDVITWGQKQCEVVVRLQVGDDNLLIKRTQGHNSLTVNGVNTFQEHLEKKLRINYRSFAYAVLMPQFGESFFDLSPADKMKIFSEIMDLEYWLDRSKDAAFLAGEIDTQLQGLQQTLAVYQEQVSSADLRLSELRKSQTTFEAERSAAIRRLKEQLRAAIAGSKQSDKAIEQVRGALRGIVSRETRTKGEIEALAQKRSPLRDKCTEAIAKKAMLESVLKRSSADLESLSDLNGGCPVCKQPITASHLKIECEKAKRAVSLAKADLKLIVRETAQAVDAMSVVDNDLEAKQADIRALDTNRRDFERELSTLERTAAASAAVQSGLKERVNEEEKRSNPYVEILGKEIGVLAATKVKIEKVTDQIKKLGEEHAAVSFWVSGFKRLRLFIVEQTLRQLEIEVNNNLGSLGLMDWQVQFDIGRKNKSGGFTSGFSTFVRAPGHSELTRFEAWSGGETQRLRLAGNLGLANLIMERAGLINTIEFYDEFSAHLSDEGIQDVLDTLYERAHQMDRRIWVVDHHSLEYAGFNSVLTVEKGAAGSVLIP